MRRPPIELGAGLSGAGALIDQQDFGEVVPEAGPGLIIGAGDRS